MLIGGARLSPNDENAVTMSYSFQGKQILVLEDDALLAMDMEDFLSDLGVNVVGPVSHIGVVYFL